MSNELTAELSEDQLREEFEYYASKIRDLEDRENKLNQEMASVVRDFKAFIDEAMSLGPHGVVLTYAQNVDNDLTAVIQAAMPGLDRDSRKALFSGTGGLSTFNARIDLAKAFGLVTPKLAKELHKLRRFRNTFAHSDKILDFDHQIVIDMVAKFEVAEALDDVRALGPEILFSGWVGHLSLELQRCLDKITAKAIA